MASRRTALLAALSLTLLAACTDTSATSAPPPAVVAATSERIELSTCDGVALIGDLAFPDGLETPDVVAVFAHGRGSTRSVWAPLLRRFHGEGIPTLSIDLRGHGESTTRRGEPYQHEEFVEQDWLDMHRDVVRAGEVARDRFPGAQIVVVGLNEGGTAAAQAASVLREVRGVVVFGTEIRYSGIRVNVMSRRLQGKPLLLVRSRDGSGELVDAAREARGEAAVGVYEWPGRLMISRQLAADAGLWRAIMRVARPETGAEASG